MQKRLKEKMEKKEEEIRAKRGDSSVEEIKAGRNKKVHPGNFSGPDSNGNLGAGARE